MGFPSSSTPNLSISLSGAQNYAAAVKLQAATAVAYMAANTINTDYVFTILNQLSGVVTTMQSYESIPGLGAYAEANIQNYTGNIANDTAAMITAAQAAIAWVVANFPKDSTNTWILAYKLNADGTRTEATFSPTQTAGFQTALNALIATIS